MSLFEIVFRSADFGPGIIENMKEYSDEYIREFKWAGAYDKMIVTDRSRLLERIREGNDYPESEVRDIIIKWLNKWKCRIPYSTARGIKSGFLKAVPLIQNLPPSIENLEINHFPKITRMFELFSRIDGIGGTSTSKLLSVLNPSLFVMWDFVIARFYGVSMISTGYCSFLYMMRGVAKILREIYAEYYGHREDTLEGYLLPEGRSWTPPLAKYIDECNWIALKKRKKSLWYFKYKGLYFKPPLIWG